MYGFILAIISMFLFIFVKGKTKIANWSKNWRPTAHNTVYIYNGLMPLLFPPEADRGDIFPLGRKAIYAGNVIQPKSYLIDHEKRCINLY